MKSYYLLPNSFRKIGWIIFIPCCVVGMSIFIFGFEPPRLETHVFAVLNDDLFISGQDHFLRVITNDISNEILGVLLIISALFIAFSKEKKEDEFISKLRLESLVWATYFNYSILILAMLFIYGTPFFSVLVFNIFTTLIFFIVRYHWILYKTNTYASHEK